MVTDFHILMTRFMDEIAYVPVDSGRVTSAVNSVFLHCHWLHGTDAWKALVEESWQGRELC